MQIQVLHRIKIKEAQAASSPLLTSPRSSSSSSIMGSGKPSSDALSEDMCSLSSMSRWGRFVGFWLFRFLLPPSTPLSLSDLCSPLEGGWGKSKKMDHRTTDGIAVY